MSARRWIESVMVFVAVVTAVAVIVRVTLSQIRNQTLAMLVVSGLTLWLLTWVSKRGARRG